MVEPEVGLHPAPDADRVREAHRAARRLTRGRVRVLAEPRPGAGGGVLGDVPAEERGVRGPGPQAAAGHLVTRGGGLVVEEHREPGAGGAADPGRVGRDRGPGGLRGQLGGPLRASDLGAVGGGDAGGACSGEVGAALAEHPAQVGVVAAGGQRLDHVEVEGGGLGQPPVAGVDAGHPDAVEGAALADQVGGLVADAAVGVHASGVLDLRVGVVQAAAHPAGLAEPRGVAQVAQGPGRQVLPDRPPGLP